MDKHKRKLEKRLKKFHERSCIRSERKKFIQIIVNKNCKSPEYLELINHTIKRLDSNDILKGMALKLKGMGHSAYNDDLYEKYRVMVADELWKNKDIQAKFPDHFFYVHKSNTSLLLWVNVRSFNYDSPKDYWRSPEDIRINNGGENYKLCWSSHAVTRLIERYKSDNYAAFADIAFILYFLNWFDFKMHKEGDYLCIYMVNEDNAKRCDLVGIAPVVINDDRMVIKTFLPNDFVSNHYGLNLVIAKPTQYAQKCHILDKAGYSEPLYKSSIINRWK